jgi:hypothetical protein
VNPSNIIDLLLDVGCWWRVESGEWRVESREWRVESIPHGKSDLDLKVSVL